MSDKIIDEVMELVDSYAAMQGVDPYDKQVDAHDAIRAKLREVLDRKPLNINVVHSLIPNLGERDAWDIEDMYTIARSVEKQHNIVS